MGETPCFALLLSGLLFALVVGEGLSLVEMAAGYEIGRVGQRQGSEPELFYSEEKKGKRLFSNARPNMFLETFLY